MPLGMIQDVRTIGDRVKEIFEERLAREPELTGADVNEAIGKKRLSGYFSRLMNNQRNERPDREAIKQIADYFGVSFEWLYLGRGPKYAPTGMPTTEAELLRASVQGLAPPAPAELPDNLDAAVRFRPARYSDALIAQVRRELREQGIHPNSRTPVDWDEELTQRLIRSIGEDIARGKARDAQERTVVNLLEETQKRAAAGEKR
jgi:transcriptional regulator with XRE-family HTH domain